MVERNRDGSFFRRASMSPRKLNSVSKTLASRPIFEGEWASELETRAKRSRAESRRFMGGSEDRPVSRAKIDGVISSKHSSMASNPEFAPKSENQGVQMCEGMTTARGAVSATIRVKRRTSRPRMGRPSEARLPTA
jgi:hypothetical protein